jgi:molybdopterin-containing oxidoreductase family iron-sulfur binding subunit
VSKPNNNLKSYWRSIKSAPTRLPVLGNANAGGEFPPGADELEIPPGASRRKFMGILGASTALAGLGSGCVRKPVEHILPYAKRPEDLIPGTPVYYATACQVGPTVVGLLVESQDGRPTKIEGNPQHSGSLGATDVWSQAEVLNFYDPDRSQIPMGTTQAAYAISGDRSSAKEAALEVLCGAVRDRVLADTNSRDQADQAANACREHAEKNGKWSYELTDKGQQAAFVVEGDQQVDSDWGTAWYALDEVFEELRKDGGNGVALVVPQVLSPSLRAQIRDFQKAQPKARVFLDDPLAPSNTIAASEALGGKGTRFYYELTDARVIVSADSDFLGHEQDHVRLTREYADGRKIDNPRDPMNRLYVMGPSMNQTAAQADNRLSIKAGAVANVLSFVARELMDTHGMKPPGGSDAMAAAISKPKLDEAQAKFAQALAKDLADNKGKAVILVGERQPVGVHGLGLFINMTLRALGGGPQPSLMRNRNDVDAVATESLVDLAEGLEKGDLKTVICLGTNPVYDAPGSLGMADKLSKARLLIHCGLHRDETGQVAHWHLPTSHFLEAWGDLEASDGTSTIQQPLIAPLYKTPSLLEVLARFTHPGKALDGLSLVKGYWDAEVGGGGVAERRWRRWLHDGMVSGIPRTPARPKLREWQDLGGALKALPEATDRTEVQIDIDSKVLAGSFSNNGWMQEVPDAISKLTWDNAALIARSTANELGVKNGDMVEVKVGDAAVTLPAWVSPGQHPQTVALRLGYGRRGLGSVADDAGFDINPVRNHETPYFAEGKISQGAGSYELISTQDHGALDPDDSPTFLVDPPGAGAGFDYKERTLYRETDRQGYKQNPKFAKEGDLMPPHRLKSLWKRPDLTAPQQWAMSIDLNSCTGCNTCTVACQAENNIPVVGKAMVIMGREMHWIRIDRYYRGDADNPEMVTQPIPCMQCEAAPCETVCPVAATTHSPDGLNDMVYNRCIGTRYCSNNCPYKVRRYNYFNFHLGIGIVEQMHHNPDVTVRTRGVMEKCTYCVQRITEEKIQAHVRGEEKVPDGNIVTACEQACPASAITFGDKNDPRSRVAKLKKRDRNYVLLADINTAPRTSFLGRVRNPNPELKPKEKPKGDAKAEGKEG